jgi:3-deoxy-D-manno-octulosonate 8-phosphate phosphatase (KDO 8-P phosphatase)
MEGAAVLTAKSPDEAALVARARQVRMILMDVDGVLTDGSLVYMPDGGEAKAFHARDGAGIKLAQRAGLMIGIISGRESLATLRRAEELGLDEIHQHVSDKQATFDEMLARRGFSDDQVCFIGDDVVDVSVMKRVGLPAAPADAHPTVLEHAALVTQHCGGRGAVREVIDLILRAQEKWNDVTAPYL